MKTKILLTALLMVCTINLFCQIIHVPGDQPTIQAGINAASTGDTVLVDPETYMEVINFNGKNITVASLYLTTQDTSYISQTIIDANEDGTVVIFENGEDSTALLCGFTLQNGYTMDWDEGGGVFCNNSNPQLKYLKIINNSARISGGIRCENATIIMTHVDLFNNYAMSSSGSGGQGAGIYCLSSELSLFECKILGNTSGTVGGGIYCSSSELYLEDVIITDNTAYSCTSSGAGGGICCFGSGLTLKNVSINNNFSGAAGGLYCGASSNIVFDSINRCSIYSNGSLTTRDIISEDFLEVILDTFTLLYPTNVVAAPLENFSFDILHGIIPQANSDLYVSPGGDNSNSGLNADNPLKTIEYAFLKIISDSLDRKKINLLEGTYSTASNGEAFPIYMIENVDLVGVADSLVILDAAGGSKVMVLGGEVYNISGMTLTGGFTWYWGGGLRCYGTQGILKDLIIRDNYGDISGGGILLEDGACPTMVNVRIYQNQARSGSGMKCIDSSPTLQNVIISDNSGISSYDKAGMYLNNSNPTLINCTMVNNGKCGILCRNSTNPTLINTIIWNHLNESIHFEDYDPPNSITISWSDIEGGEDSIVTNNNGVVYWLDGNINEDPLFEGSGDHPYQLSAVSPCIDSGTPDTTGLNLPTSDIIGNKRIWDGDNNGSEIIDMGAYEFGSIPVGTEKTEVQSLRSEIRCYPNPFSNQTTIEFNLHETDFVILSIYDITGKHIETILSKKLSTGNHQIKWNVEGLNERIYFIRLKTESTTQVQKALIIK